LIRRLILQGSCNVLYNRHMEIDAVEIFVKVVQVGSFAEAARQLKVPTTTVSSKIARLETKLGATLIHRTTRKLNISPAGRAYYNRAIKALDELKAGQLEIESAASEPTGLLRISAAQDAARSLLPAIMKAYLAKYPKVSVEMVITNRRVDLVAENFDVAFRAGNLKDSQLIARKVREISGAMWATPAFLKKAGRIEKPEDLEAFESVIFAPLGREVELSNDRRKVKVRLNGRLIADEFDVVKAMAELDLGLAFLPDFVAEDGPQRSKLVRVLPDWTWARGNRLSLVYPEQAFMTPKLRAFIDVATGKDT
jgi:DNA-binding transcriptional LysR family regulator